MPRFLSPDQKIINYSTWQLVKDVAKQIKPYRGRFLLGTGLRAISDLANLYPPFALALMVSILTTGNLQDNISKLWIVTFLWIGSNLLRTISHYFCKSIIFNISDKVQSNVELQSIAHIFKLDIAWHEKENTGNKLRRISNAASGYNRLLRIWVNNAIEIAVNFVGIVIVIYQFDTTITIFTVTFLIVYFVVNKLLLKKTALASHYVNVESEQISGLQYEAVNNVRSVKIMSMIQTLNDKLHFYADRWYDKTQKKVFWLGARNSGSELVGFGFKAGILVFILYGIINGRYEVSLLVLFNGYFNRLWESVNELAGISEDVLVSRYSISRLNEIMKEPIQIDNELDKIPFPSDWKEIQLKNVSFKYGQNKVLKNISFTIRRGEKIGIIGLSGAGKSTLFKLLLKEYENFDGEILIDSTPIQQISKIDYFNHAAVVLQETEVFNFTLRENIYLAGSRTTNKEAELQKALEIAHVADFLHKLPDGVDTAIGEKGVRLSGGEKQRVGIARAVFKQPQLLLLDEATSHLDLESEEKIQDSLHRFFNTVTAVVIAHRLTTIKEMDKIIVIEDGEILESGNFAELTEKRGRFFELWEKQRL